MRGLRFAARHFPLAIFLLSILSLSTVCVKAQGEPLKLGGMITTGSIEVGMRQSMVGGNQEVYRSTVNLGSGFRLFDVSLESRSPDNTGPFYDYLSYSMTSWGGDPYNTIRLRLERHHRYRFDYNYWRMDYVNLLPTYANPLLRDGLLVNQHSITQARRVSDYLFTLFPDTEFQVRLGYGRNYGYGQALTTLSIGLDEFVLRDPARTTTNDYLVAVDAQIGRVALTFEQNWRSLKDDPAVYHPSGVVNNGNSPRELPIISTNPQQILLTSLNRNDGVRTTIPSTRIGLNARPTEGLILTGRFAYSDAEIKFNRAEILTGTLLDLTTLNFISQQRSLVDAAASRPATTADGGLYYRPLSRLTLTNSTSFDQYVIAGASSLEATQIFSLDFDGNPVPPDRMEQVVSSFLDSRTHVRALSNQAEASVDVLPMLTLRAGYRFTNRRARLTIQAPFQSVEESKFDTHTGIAGVSFRAANRLRVFGEFERGLADTVFTRVSPRHQTRLRLRSSYQPWDKLRLTGQYVLTDWRNPDRTVDNLHRSRVLTIDTSWFPNERFGLDVGYTRLDVSSSISILDPRTYIRSLSVYTADDNVVEADLNFSPLRAAEVSIGYSLINSQGTFPLNYHQPRARVAYTFPKRFTWIMTWGWYGYNEKGFTIQDYRAHLLTSSLKISF